MRQAPAEALALALLGGLAGIPTGALATVVYASSRNWAVVIPAEAWAGGIGAAIVIARSPDCPAMRAASVSPTEALRTA